MQGHGSLCCISFIWNTTISAHFFFLLLNQQHQTFTPHYFFSLNPFKSETLNFFNRSVSVLLICLYFGMIYLCGDLSKIPFFQWSEIGIATPVCFAKKNTIPAVTEYFKRSMTTKKFPRADKTGARALLLKE